MDKNYIKLVDGTQIDFETGSTLSSIKHISANESDAVTICSKITDANIKNIDFYAYDGKTPYQSYRYVKMSSIPTRQTNDDGTILVTICLYEESAQEKRLSAIEDSIDYLTLASLSQ